MFNHLQKSFKQLNSINIIFPNQLFEESNLFLNKKKTYLIEEHLFFKQFNFHKQKLVERLVVIQDLKMVFLLKVLEPETRKKRVINI